MVTSWFLTKLSSKIYILEYMMSEHGQDFDGMRNFLEKYLFISDDTIELQMLQGCQNWSWISQGVLGSNFRAGHRKSVG